MRQLKPNTIMQLSRDGIVRIYRGPMPTRKDRANIVTWMWSRNCFRMRDLEPYPTDPETIRVSDQMIAFKAPRLCPFGKDKGKQIGVDHWGLTINSDSSIMPWRRTQWFGKDPCETEGYELVCKSINDWLKEWGNPNWEYSPSDQKTEQGRRERRW